MSNFVGSVPSVDGIPLSGFVYPEDTFTESTAITSYREGISIMPASAVADWDGNGEDALVQTWRSGTCGFQAVEFVDSGSYGYTRLYGGGTWSDNDYRLLGNDLTAIYELKSGDKLATDQHAEADPITDYPLGVSMMPVSAVADWDGQDEDAHVVTRRSGDIGVQEITFASGYSKARWAEGSPTFGSWLEYVVFGHEHVHIYPLDYDAYAESVAIDSYFQGISLMAVSAGANWGPNTGQAGQVLTERTSDGKQTFHQYSNATSYERTYTGAAWGSWRNTKDADLLDGNDSAYFATATSVSDHLGDTSDAHDASAISILDTAAQYTATNAEDALAEVLDALQAHEADATDAHDASAISYAGSTNLAAATVEAGLDELDTEKASTGSVSTVQTNLTNHIDDTADAHDATAISFAPDGSIAATTVQAAIVEVRNEAGGGGGGSGEATLDFGAFPGATDTTLAVTGQASILSGSLVEAWVFPKATVEHSADEHWVEAIKVFAGNVVAATGFTLYARTDDKQRLYGRYNIAWKWA